MTERKNAAPGVRSTGDGIGTRDCNAAHGIPRHNCNMSEDNRQEKGPISRYLARGQQNAIPMAQLVRMTGYDGRTVRRLIEIERRAGVPICADNATGYFLAADDAELCSFVRSMLHRALEIMRTARALEKTIQGCTDQMKFEEVAP